MITDDYNEWRECLDSDRCELIASYMELIDAMVRDIQHLKAETIRARYELSQKFDPDHKWITTVDILSNLNMPHYDSMAYQQYVSTYYDGRDPLSFKEYVDSMVQLAQGIDDGTY